MTMSIFSSFHQCLLLTFLVVLLVADDFIGEAAIDNVEVVGSGGESYDFNINDVSDPSEVINRYVVLRGGSVRERPCPFAFFVPRQISPTTPPAAYPFLESGLQIFYDYKIPCDGIISEWNFIAATTAVWGLHLGVFRPSGSNTFMLVAESYINGWATNAKANGWVNYRPINVVRVKSNDLIGIFYDPDTINTADIPIRSASRQPTSRGITRRAPTTGGNARIFLYDALQFAHANFVLGENDGVLVWRTPALYAVVKGAPDQTGGQAMTTAGYFPWAATMPTPMTWIPPTWPAWAYTTQVTPITVNWPVFIYNSPSSSKTVTPYAITQWTASNQQQPTTTTRPPQWWQQFLTTTKPTTTTTTIAPKMASNKLRCIVAFHSNPKCANVQSVRFSWNPSNQTCIEYFQCGSSQSQSVIVTTGDDYCEVYCRSLRVAT